MFFIFIYILICISSGWIGYFLDILMKRDNLKEGFGMLFLIFVPSIIGLIYSFFINNPKIIKNTQYFIYIYIFCFFFDIFYFLMYFLLLKIKKLDQLKGKIIIKSFFKSIPMLIFKNIFEEYIFRGFLFSLLFNKFNIYITLVINTLTWYFWHFPLWIKFISKEEYLNFSPYKNYYFNFFINFIILFLLNNLYFFIYLYFFNFIPLIIIHTINNSIVQSFTLELNIKDLILNSSITSPIYIIILLIFNLIYFKYYLISIILSIISLLFIIIYLYFKDFQKINNEDNK